MTAPDAETPIDRAFNATDLPHGEFRAFKAGWEAARRVERCPFCGGHVEVVGRSNLGGDLIRCACCAQVVSPEGAPND